MCGMPHLSLRISASADDVLTPCEDGTRSANCDDHHSSNCSPDKPSAEQTFSIESPAPSFLSSDLSVIFTSISGIGFLQCHAFNNLPPLVMSGRFAYVFAWRALYSHIAFLFAHWSLTEKVEHTYCNFTQPFTDLVQDVVYNCRVVLNDLVSFRAKISAQE